MRVMTDVLLDRNVELHRGLVVLEKQPLDVIHLRPVRAAVLARYADVFPSAVRTGDNRHERTIDWRRHDKHAGLVVADRAIPSERASVGRAETIEGVEIAHFRTHR